MSKYMFNVRAREYPSEARQRVHVQTGHPNIGHTRKITYLPQQAWKCSQRNLQEKSQTSPGLGANKSRDQQNQSRSYRRQGTMYCQVSAPGCTRENFPMEDEVWCSLNFGIHPMNEIKNKRNTIAIWSRHETCINLLQDSFNLVFESG